MDRNNLKHENNNIINNDNNDTIKNNDKLIITSSPLQYEDNNIKEQTNNNENINLNKDNDIHHDINKKEIESDIKLNNNNTNNETNLNESSSNQYIKNDNNNNDELNLNQYINKNNNNLNCNCFLICKCYDYGDIKHNTIEDIEVLKSSIGFLKCDDTSITSILSNRNWSEKNLIIKKYNDRFNKSLEKDLRSHTNGNYKNSLISILTEPSIYDTIQVRNALRTSNIYNLNEILITRNNQQKEMIKRIYLIKYGIDLEHVIVGKFKGTMRQLSLAMIQNLRDNDNLDSNNNNIDMKLIKDDSRRLYKGGEGRKGTDTTPFIEIFTKRSFAHISQLNSFYQSDNPKGHSLFKAIELEFNKGNLKNTLLDILLYATEPFKYWAQCYNRALSKWGTNENDLTRLSITQHHHANNIKQAYLSLYNQSLILNISKKTSRKYKKLLLLLINV